MATRWGLALSVASIMLAFAGNSVITRYLIVGGLASPVLLTIVRFVSGFGMLLLLRVTFPRSFSGPFRGRPDLIGGFFLGLYAFSISFGYEFISAAAGTLVFYAFVILTMALFGVVHDRETPTPRSIVGQILALAGVAVIAFGGIREVSLPGVALMAVTGSSWGLYSAHGRSGGDPRAYTFNTFLVLAGFCLLLIPVAEIVAPGALSIQISGNGLGLALFMGMISTSLSYVLWHLTLRRIKASQGGIVQLVVPVLASLMGIGLLGEHLTVTLVLGGASVLAGIYLNRVNRGPR
ncbi:MAG: DMT family transporter [Methanobacteriota archaeon]|nr:MAG: DMT family transporter [Euryarchaeota archaeon]